MDERLRMRGRKNRRVVIKRLQRAVPAHERRRADAHMHVGGARGETEPQELDDAHAVRQPIRIALPGDHFGVGLRRRCLHGWRGRMRLGLHARLFQGGVGLHRRSLDRMRRRIQRLAQALRLFRRDDRLFQQKIDRRQMGHRLQCRHRGVILVEIDPAGMIRGGKNELVMLGSHGKK